MDKLNTYALIAALRGLDATSDKTVGVNRRQNDKWTALLASEKEQVEPMLDAQPKEPAPAAASTRVSYVRQINNRIDQAMTRTPGQK